MFLCGAIAVIPILVYKSLWKYFPWLNAFRYTNSINGDLLGLKSITLIPLSVVITFMLVGVIEEITKNLAMRFGDRIDTDRIRDIDDAILYSILAALGFSFAENILYFYNIWSTQGLQNLFYPFVFRSVLSTFAHLMFSGIFGYFYGIAYFAKPILQEEIKQKRNVWERVICKHIRCKAFEVFHKEKVVQGFFIAVALHAVFNIFLEMNWTFLIIPYLTGGFFYLSYLFALKRNHKRYDLLYVGERNTD